MKNTKQNSSPDLTNKSRGIEKESHFIQHSQAAQGSQSISNNGRDHSQRSRTTLRSRTFCTHRPLIVPILDVVMALCSDRRLSELVSERAGGGGGT
jgi:hypothetical protein